MVVFEIASQVVPPSVEYSHRTTLPTLPLRLIEPLFTVPHNVVVPLRLPPVVAGFTVTTYVPVNEVLLQLGELVLFTIFVNVYVTVAELEPEFVSEEGFIANEPDPVPVNVLAVEPSL